MSNEVAVATAPSEPEWAAFAAIGWADQKNFWRLLQTSSEYSSWEPSASRGSKHSAKTSSVGSSYS
jgi:hypothetical protein